MNWYSVFYWLTVSDGVKEFLDTASNWFCFFTVIFGIIMIVAMIAKSVVVDDQNLKDEAEEKVNPRMRAWEFARKSSFRLFYPFLFITLITWVGYVMVPSKKDCLMIIAGGSVGNFITTDSSAKQLPSDITKFLHLSLKKEISELNEDTRAELGLQTPKEEFLTKVKKMTKEELVDYIQNDSTLLK